MSSDYEHDSKDYRLNDLTQSMQYRNDGKPEIRVNSTFDGDVVITGNVNVPGTVTVNSTPEDPIHTHITEIGTSGVLNVPYMPVGGTVTVNQPLAVTDNGSSLTVDGSVSVSNFPASQAVTGTFWPTTQPVSGTVNIGTIPEVEIKNDLGNPIAITGTVNTSITDVVSVIVNEDAGLNFSFNNHAAAVHRGWVMDDTMRPVVSVRVKDTGTTTADIIKIIEYEIGNNNANQSTIIYEWYEGPLTISGAAIPAWTNLGTKIQYRIYQDQYSSNQGNTFTVPTGTHMRHSGIIIGKNSSGDEGPASLYGGATPNMLTLCMKRVDNGTELDVWFAFTIKELS